MNTFKTTILMALLTALLVVVGRSLGGQQGIAGGGVIHLGYQLATTNTLPLLYIDTAHGACRHERKVFVRSEGCGRDV